MIPLFVATVNTFILSSIFRIGTSILEMVFKCGGSAELETLSTFFNWYLQQKAHYFDNFTEGFLQFFRWLDILLNFKNTNHGKNCKINQLV